MLSLLHIENVAVIEEADIVFDAGFNVLTGETGAGKSIVIDAISAILGERTYREVIRTGCDSASVSAVFTNMPSLSWFEEHQIPWDGAETLVQREIFADGRNLCRVNGKPVTVSILKELGSRLINIHGQNDTQTLFREETHLDYLDLYAGAASEQEAYATAYEEYVQCRDAVKLLQFDEGERLRQLETLQYQLEEIERGELVSGEEEELTAKRKLLANAERVCEHLSSAVFALYGSENERGAVDLLSTAEKELSRLGSISQQFETLAQTLSELRCNAQDCSEELRNELESLSYSGDELEKTENRLEQLSRLRKKYGATIEDVIAYGERAQLRLEELENADSRLAEATKKLNRAEERAEAAALLLRKARVTAAERFRSRLEEELAQLDMPNIRFSVEFTELPLSESGMDGVRFLMSANLGESMKALSKVASGGELARIMLALKNVLAERDQVGTLIFDEVDAGVSGRAAQKVAEKLLRVSKGKQVLCVTHLPQIAAIADAHLLIQKEARQGRTYTSVEKLSRDGRIRELSRIIGGADITDNTRKSAEDMLRL